jgi:hypothetical protein
MAAPVVHYVVAVVVLRGKAIASVPLIVWAGASLVPALIVVRVASLIRAALGLSAVTLAVASALLVTNLSLTLHLSLTSLLSLLIPIALREGEASGG